MKKIYLFATLLAFLGIVACEDVYDHMAAPPQSHEQEVEQALNGFNFTLGSGLSSAVVLSEEDLDNATVLEAVKTTATPQLAEGATVKFKLELSNTEDFTRVVELHSVSENNTASITANDLNETVKSLYGKAPNARTVYLRAVYYIVDGTSSSQVPDPVILGPVTVTPVGPVIETEYYIIGNLNGWNIEGLDDYKFNHSGRDVYEDPHFTILVNTMLDADGNGYFKIVPKSSKDAASWDGVIGNPVDGNTATEGELVMGGDAMRVEEPGWVKVTLNMMEYTYTIEVIGEMNLTLYVPGGYQGWNPGAAPTLYSRDFNFKYEGYVNFNEASEFKITSAPNWDGTNYGDEGDGTLSTDGGNLSVSESGYYKINVDLSGAPYKYTLTKTDWGLIGSATDGGWDNSTPMTYNADTKVWSVTTTLKADEFKFRANNGWDINLGGDLNNLSYGGDNIKITEAGTYKVSLDLSDPATYKASVVKQ